MVEAVELAAHEDQLALLHANASDTAVSDRRVAHVAAQRSGRILLRNAQAAKDRAKLLFLDRVDLCPRCHGRSVRLSPYATVRRRACEPDPGGNPRLRWGWDHFDSDL